jgi:eukaryotic-like serine/threonine-protein kinase
MTDQHTQLPQPEAIGPYKVLGVLGEGGMGMVYLAEQVTPVRRRVALKILKLGMDTKQVVARFKSERQALAVMDHPNIAKVLDSGVTDEGRPYFVMELVHGTPITSYADTHRLTTTERLRLFMDVCAAVQHAHHKGVIHRDIKPSNVMVTVQDERPVVKVIDFGIAKAVGLGLTESTLVTRQGQILGTPEYMSPEQAEMSGLDVDTRTDIYSLGVMLYELLVGVLPFDLSAKPDYVIAHTLREHEVPRPSTRLTSLGDALRTVARSRRTNPDALRREVRGDLDWIILKAMEKDRTRRYDTARGLANDIRRHLDDEPVKARPPSARDRIGKFVRRNRTPVLAGAVALAAVLTGTAAATLGFLHARAEQRRAEQAAVTAEQVTDFLVELFTVSNPGEAPDISARELLDRGVERVPAALGGQPAVQARLLRAMGDVYRNLGLYQTAGPLLEQAVAIQEGRGRDGEVELARTLRSLGILYRRQGRNADAEAALKRAVALTRQTGPSETLELASTQRSLAAVYQVLGRYGDAEPLLREALAVQEGRLPPDDPDLAVTVSNLAAMYLLQRRPDLAEPYQRRSLAITEGQYGHDHPHVGAELINLGELYLQLGRMSDAEASFQRAMRILTRALDPDHPYIALTLVGLAEVNLNGGEYAEAEAQLLRSLDISERTVGREHASLAPTLRGLGNVYREQGRVGEADAAYQRALRIFAATMDTPDASVRETYEDYARHLRLTGRAEEAARLEARAAEIPVGDQR